MQLTMEQTALILGLVGTGLAALRLWFPPKHVIEASRVTTPNMSPLVEAITRMAIMQENQIKTQDARAAESTLLHRDTMRHIEKLAEAVESFKDHTREDHNEIRKSIMGAAKEIAGSLKGATA